MTLIVGLKATAKKVIKNIEVYGEMHRYIPYLAKNAGFKKIGEKWCIIRHENSAKPNSAAGTVSLTVIWI